MSVVLDVIGWWFASMSLGMAAMIFAARNAPVPRTHGPHGRECRCPW